MIECNIRGSFIYLSIDAEETLMCKFDSQRSAVGVRRTGIIRDRCSTAFISWTVDHLLTRYEVFCLLLVVLRLFQREILEHT